MLDMGFSLKGTLTIEVGDRSETRSLQDGFGTGS